MNHPWIKFVSACAIIAAVWLLLLPALSTEPMTAARIERLESKGIDPSAMFYTDLDMMEEVSHRWNESTAKHPDALWVPMRRNKRKHKQHLSY